MMPEERCVQDGELKEDCEVNVFMHFMDKFRKDHSKLGVIINGDALYGTTPAINAIHITGIECIRMIKKGRIIGSN